MARVILKKMVHKITLKYIYFKVIANTYYVSSWKSKGLSAETIKPLTTFENSLTTEGSYYGAKTRVNLLEVV